VNGRTRFFHPATGPNARAALPPQTPFTSAREEKPAVASRHCSVAMSVEL